MAPLVLEGETLGQKHRHYNNFLKECLSNKDATEEIQKINYDEPDTQNLLKIDIACHKKNVEYVLEVLKCEDVLYVSRAIKQSVWLITDDEFAHIINTDYMHSKLLPQMTSKAGLKLLLNVRLNLKDTKRVEEFYTYYSDKNELKTALKWLPNCSIPFIESIVEKHASEIPCHLIKKLCEKSSSILEICDRKNDGKYIRDLFSKSVFLLNSDPIRYLNIINAQELYNIPHFSPKSTKLIMKSYPDVIFNNFEKFASKIDIPSFTKFLKKDTVKEFLLTHTKNRNLKEWFTFDKIRLFVARMPSDSRFEFIKQECIEKSLDVNPKEFPSEFEEESNCDYVLRSATPNVVQSSRANIYRWYRFATFSTAFTDLKKLIRLESNPNERNEMFAVLIICARRNLLNIQKLVQYYHDQHINEPFKFKSHFINMVLRQSCSHKFDNKTWSNLNDIFYSMEVYGESENNVQSCLKHIMLYHVLHNQNVPEIIESKFQFDTLKSFQSKLNKEEKDKVFRYLYQMIIAKIRKLNFKSESDLIEAKSHIMNILMLLKDWQKDLLDHSVILEKIEDLTESKRKNYWNGDLSDIYNVNKTWRKYMFTESLFMHPNSETYVNALKHGPHILTLNEEYMVTFDSTSFIKSLKKIRIYWPETLAKNFEDTFFNQLNNEMKCKTAVRGLCILLPRKQLADLINKYKPENTKIKWADSDDVSLSIQKYLAKYIHLARPQLSVELVLLFSKGDYLQFALPSIHSILYNISIDQSLQHIPTFLDDTPVSLKKHGLKFAFAKLKTDELIKVGHNIWESNKNPLIRASVFKLVFDLLCKERDETKIGEIWHLLSRFIRDLTHDENKNIYITLGKVDKVPFKIKPYFCIDSYRFLKSLPSKAHCNNIVASVIHFTLDIMEYLDLEFISEIIFDHFDKKFGRPNYQYTKVISSSLLSTKSVIKQTERYESIFVPLFQKYLAFLNDAQKDHYHLKQNFDALLGCLITDIQYIVLEKGMVTPIRLFNDIYLILEKSFSDEEHYVRILTWKLAAEYMKLIDTFRPKINDSQAEDAIYNELDESKTNDLNLEVAPEFGKICMHYLHNDTRKYFASIYRLFSKGIEGIFHRLPFSDKARLKIVKSIQEHANINEGLLLVLEVIPRYVREKEDGEERTEIIKKLGSHSSAEVRMVSQQILRELEIYT